MQINSDYSQKPSIYHIPTDIFEMVSLEIMKIDIFLISHQFYKIFYLSINYMYMGFFQMLCYFDCVSRIKYFQSDTK